MRPNVEAEPRAAACRREPALPHASGNWKAMPRLAARDDHDAVGAAGRRPLRTTENEADELPGSRLRRPTACDRRWLSFVNDLGDDFQSHTALALKIENSWIESF